MIAPGATISDEGAEALIATAMMLRSAALTNNETKWIDEIAPGHLVVEFSKRVFDRARIGTVISCGRPQHGDYDVVVIEDIDGIVRRWTNAAFIRIPRNNRERLESRK